MKKLLKLFLLILFANSILQSCKENSTKLKEETKNHDTSKYYSSELDEKSNISKEKTIEVDNKPKDSIAELLYQLKNIPTGNYMVKGELKTDILKFVSVGFGDLLHLGFVDKNNKEYDFNGNVSNVELCVDAKIATEKNGGYEPDKKYLNKNFRVVWRRLKLKHKPKDEMEMYYEEYDEIIYLKKIN